MLTEREKKQMVAMLELMRSPVAVGGEDTVYKSDVETLIEQFVQEKTTRGGITA